MSLIRKPAQLTVQPCIKVLDYGQPGIGKTTLALSAPSPLLLDFDRGVHRVSPKHQVDTLQVTCWEDVQSVLSEDLSAYKTLVIDTAGKMLDYMASFIIKNDPKLAKKDGSLSLQGYGSRKVMFTTFLHSVELLGKHLVFVAHDKEEKDGDSRFVRPEIGGSSGNDLIREIDLVGYMEASGKKRTISFDPCEKFYGKNTCNLPTLIELPDVVTGGKENTLLSEIFKIYTKSIEDRKLVAEQYNALMSVIRDGIDVAANIEELNSLVPWAQSLEVIWDSKLQASMLIKAKATSLGAKYNKKTNVYELEPGKEQPKEEVKEQIKDAEPVKEAEPAKQPEPVKDDKTEKELKKLEAKYAPAAEEKEVADANV